MDFNIIATTTFGLEGITSKELKALGYDDLVVENGKVEFEGDEMDVAIANVHLRTAERVLIKMGEFKALSFEELFQATKKIKWSEIIPVDGVMHVTGKSIKSQLYSVPDCQSIVKKAIVESMKESYGIERFEENGPVYKIEVAILKDIVTLTIDTSGPGLHKRGYREDAGAAPLKETLAAALALISRWNEETPLLDPFCGSGTLLIEAAMIMLNIPPGLCRSFVSEDWHVIGREVFEDVKAGAEKAIKNKDIKLYGYDIDGRVLRVAKQNAEKAGVAKYIHFQRKDFNDFSSSFEHGCILTNPPYGERLGEKREVEELYKKFGLVKRRFDGWDFNILTSHEQFEKLFGRKADKNRKLYNGRIKCYYYQYFDNDLIKNHGNMLINKI